MPPNGGSQKHLVQATIDFRHICGSLEAPLILSIVAPKGANMVKRPLLQPEEIMAIDQVAVRHIFVCIGNDRLIEAGWQRIDHVDTRNKLAVLFGGNLARDKNTEMANAVMHCIDDRLAILDNLPVMPIEIEYPPHRLLRRRRDVVAPRAEHDDRCPDIAEVDPH